MDVFPTPRRYLLFTEDGGVESHPIDAPYTGVVFRLGRVLLDCTVYLPSYLLHTSFFRIPLLSVSPVLQ
jgi:hypothetical protein